MNRIVHFEIQAQQPERAAGFYSEVFGWEIKEWVIPGVEMKDENRYWLVSTGSDSEPGINGGILFRRGEAPTEGQAVNGYICTIDVASLDDSLKKVTDAGGTQATPRMPVMGIGWVAYCHDTEGNMFCMMQEDPNAK